ncbi:class II lanthipeptide, LchA2/BrtA2 family [Caldifermentibacillus hisashii]|uniref:class II lanthipeptide, LchA2/BrtA2 family n=1 Tax=Caldifermentibacillus hisashii TaxID=996558 RepID=UPI0031359BDF
MNKKEVFVEKVSEEELMELAGGSHEVQPQSTVLCLSLRLCPSWSIKLCPSIKIRCPMDVQ